MRLGYAQTLSVGIAHPTAILYLIMPCYLRCDRWNLWGVRRFRSLYGLLAAD